MQVLGSQNYFQKPIHLIRQQSAPFETPPLQLQKTRYQSSHLGKRKRTNTESKRSLMCDSPVEDFKQNKLKQKVFKQLQQLDKLNSNMQLLTTPFSSVLNTKNHGNNSSSNKSQQKTFQTQASHASKKLQQYHETKKELQKGIEQVIENKLNNITQNKRKSVSYRIHVPPKQFNYNLESKRNFYQLPIQLQHKNDHCKQSNPHEEEEKIMQVNRQKSSQSFVIRKKINSNVHESQKPQKQSNRLTYCVQKFRKDRFVKQEKFNDFIQRTNKQISQVLKSQTSPKHSFTPLGGQTNELRSNDKETLIKPHHMKGVKGLKVRVNKLIKAQQNMFSEESGTQSKCDQISEKQEKKSKAQNLLQTQENQQLKLETQIQMQILQKPIKIAQNKQKEQIHYIETTKQEKSFIQDSIELSKQETNDVISVPQIQDKAQWSQIMRSKEHLKLKTQKQAQDMLNIKNRKNRISSIRAIKNYCKKIDTEQKCSFMVDQKQPKEISTLKKKEKPCLTHKIKWGNLSKKKLNTDRGFGNIANHLFTECSVDEKVEFKIPKYAKQYQKAVLEKDPKKTTIETQLEGPTTKKKHFPKVQFVVEQGQTIKAYQQANQAQNTTPKAMRNVERMFSQTINSKQFIDFEPIPYHAGSKSLIMFEDPGISLIANNNDSIHIAQTPYALPSFQRPSLTVIQGIEKNMISPVPVMKKRKHDGVDERLFGENYPMESLQELFYELKSHKSINLKVNDQLRVDSLQELFQK